MSKRGASKGLDFDAIRTTSGEGCSMSSFIMLDSPLMISIRSLHPEDVPGLISSMIMSSGSAVVSFINFRTVSNRGNDDDLNSYKLSISSTRIIT